jgi:D-aminopeptidase
VLVLLAVLLAIEPSRPRLRDWGVKIGILTPGPLNAITDVDGVRVGHATVVRSDSPAEKPSVNTGVTVVLPHGRNLAREKVPAAVVVGNAFGKLAGGLQVNELGELESPVVLTCTLCVGKAWDATVGWMLAQAGNEDLKSFNPVIGECNDSQLSDIRRRPISEDDVLRALRDAKGGPVQQGSVGAGRGTVAFGWKGGIGTSSRKLPAKMGGWTMGVLVQTNYSGILSIAGAPVGIELGQYLMRDDAGSVIIVIATDAPLDHRQLSRVGRRALLGIGRTGSPMTHGSGDFVVAFVTRRETPAPDEKLTPLFEAAVEATEEAAIDSLFQATTVESKWATVEALPLERVRGALKKHGVLP